MDNYHITKNGENWQLKKTGNERATLIADTKAEVIKEMREYMQDHEGSVKVHRADGVIQTEWTYPKSADPHKTPG